ncbi:MAG: GDP-mannose 4,6-dehydratase [Kiritimatiellae bacterium]|jgi:GDP-4-dehydro-6-deoxy-D-mannose reductase|nr:GDP-mannose 4,6-dehydratase [Kiritimatiellia bacterium]
MKCLITGAGGFIGSCLAEYLLGQDQSVVAAMRRPDEFLKHLNGRLAAACGDLTDAVFIDRLLERHEPDIIFHLAAQSLPLVSWTDPALTFRANLTGSLKLFEGAERQSRPPLIIAVSSSSVYAPGRENIPIAEDAPLRPDSIYAASKLAMEHLAGIYCAKKNLKTICVRPFFIIGPRKTGDVSSDFARGIARIERGKESELRVGNLENIRDFLDVRDCVSALWQIALRGKIGGVYNICSGAGHSIGALLDIFRKNTGADLRIVNDPEKMRPIDNPDKTGDPARLKALGWQPQVDLETSVKAILDYWRKVF